MSDVIALQGTILPTVDNSFRLQDHRRTRKAPRMNFAPSILTVLFLCAISLAQMASPRCDSPNPQLKDCGVIPSVDTLRESPPIEINAPKSLPDFNLDIPENPKATALGISDDAWSTIANPNTQSLGNQGFRWRRALLESFTFLVIEQSYVVHSDLKWVVSENGIPFNHYWSDYKHSLWQWVHSPWNDGDPNWFGYIGHPVQGALTGFIQIQNDPQGEKQEFSRTKAYWWSRLKAGLWNTAYSTQWNLGPLSEVTVEKYGTLIRGQWNYNGTYPCTKHCVYGVGQIDIVMTPLAGTGWLIGEDFLDSKVVRRLEGRTQNRLLINSVRCALNPIRGGASILHGRHPWYRARDTKE